VLSGSPVSSMITPGSDGSVGMPQATDAATHTPG